MPQAIAIEPAVARYEPPALQQNSALTPMEMLSAAVSNGASVEILSKLMDLQERWQNNEARRAFDAAVSAAKKDMPAITKNATGHNNKKYANFAAIAREVDPILGTFGLSYRFRTAQDDKAIRVTCVLSHKDGYSEETTLAGPADATGNKNAIQAIGSTLTYLQRYTLVQMLGLASAEDDDGKAGGAGETISDEQRATLDTLLTETESDFAAFCDFWQIAAVVDLPAAKFPQAVALLQQRKKVRGK